jgi:hypothetical protein
MTMWRVKDLGSVPSKGRMHSHTLWPHRLCPRTPSYIQYIPGGLFSGVKRSERGSISPSSAEVENTWNFVLASIHLSGVSSGGIAFSVTIISE